jgi:hypothetical protein
LLTCGFSFPLRTGAMLSLNFFFAGASEAFFWDDPFLLDELIFRVFGGGDELWSLWGSGLVSLWGSRLGSLSGSNEGGCRSSLPSASSSSSSW